MEGASDAAREQARRGLRGAIDDALANVKRTMTDGDVAAREAFQLLKDMSSRANREKITTVLGKDTPPTTPSSGRELVPYDPTGAGRGTPTLGADQLFKEMDEAIKSFELRAAVATNAKTFTRQTAHKVVQDTVEGGPVAALFEGKPVDFGQGALSAIFGRGKTANQAKTDRAYDKIVEALIQEPPASTLGRLRRAPDYIARNQAQAGDLAARIGQRATSLIAPSEEGRLQRQLRGGR